MQNSPLQYSLCSHLCQGRVDVQLCCAKMVVLCDHDNLELTDIYRTVPLRICSRVYMEVEQGSQVL